MAGPLDDLTARQLGSLAGVAFHGLLLDHVVLDAVPFFDGLALPSGVFFLKGAVVFPFRDELELVRDEVLVFGLGKVCPLMAVEREDELFNGSRDFLAVLHAHRQLGTEWAGFFVAVEVAVGRDNSQTASNKPTAIDTFKVGELHEKSEQQSIIHLGMT